MSYRHSFTTNSHAYRLRDQKLILLSWCIIILLLGLTCLLPTIIAVKITANLSAPALDICLPIEAQCNIKGNLTKLSNLEDVDNSDASFRVREGQEMPSQEEIREAFEGVSYDEFVPIDIQIVEEAAEVLGRIVRQDEAAFLLDIASNEQLRAPPQELLDTTPSLSVIFDKMYGIVYFHGGVKKENLIIYIAPDIIDIKNPQLIPTLIHETIEAYGRLQGDSIEEAHQKALDAEEVYYDELITLIDLDPPSDTYRSYPGVNVYQPDLSVYTQSEGRAELSELEIFYPETGETELINFPVLYEFVNLLIDSRKVLNYIYMGDSDIMDTLNKLIMVASIDKTKIFLVKEFQEDYSYMPKEALLLQWNEDDEIYYVYKQMSIADELVRVEDIFDFSDDHLDDIRGVIAHIFEDEDRQLLRIRSRIAGQDFYEYVVLGDDRGRVVITDRAGYIFVAQQFLQGALMQPHGYSFGTMIASQGYFIDKETGEKVLEIENTEAKDYEYGLEADHEMRYHRIRYKIPETDSVWYRWYLTKHGWGEWAFEERGYFIEVKRIDNLPLLRSYEAEKEFDLKYLARTYDQALAAIAFIRAFEATDDSKYLEYATAIFNFYANTAEKIDWALPFSEYDVATSLRNEYDINADDAILLAIAMAYYQYITNDTRYHWYLTEITDYIIEVLQDDMDGGILFSPYRKLKASEHNLDAVSLFGWMYMLTGNNIYEEARYRVVKWLITEMYDEEMDHFFRGAKENKEEKWEVDQSFATDVQARAVQTLYPLIGIYSELDIIEFDKVMQNLETSAIVTTTTEDGKTVTGYFFHDGKRAISYEWTLQAIESWKIIGEHGIAQAYLDSISIAFPQGIIPHIYRRIRTIDGWEETIYNSVAATVWYLFATENFTPLVVPDLNTSEGFIKERAFIDYQDSDSPGLSSIEWLIGRRRNDDIEGPVILNRWIPISRLYVDEWSQTIDAPERTSLFYLFYPAKPKFVYHTSDQGEVSIEDIVPVADLKRLIANLNEGDLIPKVQQELKLLLDEGLRLRKVVYEYAEGRKEYRYYYIGDPVREAVIIEENGLPTFTINLDWTKDDLGGFYRNSLIIHKDWGLKEIRERGIDYVRVMDILSTQMVERYSRELDLSIWSGLQDIRIALDTPLRVTRVTPKLLGGSELEGISYTEYNGPVTFLYTNPDDQIRGEIAVRNTIESIEDWELTFNLWWMVRESEDPIPFEVIPARITFNEEGDLVSISNNPAFNIDMVDALEVYTNRIAFIDPTDLLDSKGQGFWNIGFDDVEVSYRDKPYWIDRNEVYYIETVFKGTIGVIETKTGSAASVYSGKLLYYKGQGFWNWGFDDVEVVDEYGFAYWVDSENLIKIEAYAGN